MKKYGLPTFPIADGMKLGKRDLDEMQWLIDRGHFERYEQSRIEKASEKQYQYFRIMWGMTRTEELKAEAASLQELLKLVKDDSVTRIYHWKWYSGNPS